MSRFAELQSHINYVMDQLLLDQDLLKLLYYQNSNPLSQLDIATPKSLIYQNIYPYPKIPKVEETQKSFLSVIFSNAKLSSNIKFKNSKLIFYIMCHIDTWAIADTDNVNGIRPYAISSRIDTIFNEKRGTPLTLGKILFSDWIYREWENKFCGYILIYDLVDIG